MQMLLIYFNTEVEKKQAVIARMDWGKIKRFSYIFPLFLPLSNAIRRTVLQNDAMSSSELNQEGENRIVPLFFVPLQLWASGAQCSPPRNANPASFNI